MGTIIAYLIIISLLVRALVRTGKKTQQSGAHPGRVSVAGVAEQNETRYGF